MKPQILLAGASALCLLTTLASYPANAQNAETFTLKSEVSAGVGMDTNVGISDLDQNTGEDDLALLLGLKLDGEVKASDRLKIRGGYEFTDTRYEDYEDFSLQIHRASLEAAYDLDLIEAGLLYTGAHARLGGEGYLNYQQLSPYVSKLLDNKVFLRGSAEFSQKDFKTDDRRDADGNAVRGDVYYFFDGTRNYVSLSGKLTEENASSKEFSYSGREANIRYTKKADLFDRETRFQLGAGWEDQDYEGRFAPNSQARTDEIVSVNSSLEFELVGPLSLDLGYKYRDRSSNLPSADYDEHVGELRFVASF